MALGCFVLSVMVLTAGQPLPARASAPLPGLGAHSEQAAPPSAIGNEAPVAFALSPDFTTTDFAAVVAVAVGGCSSACTHMWVTRDAGYSWHRARGFSGSAGHLAIVESRPRVESLVFSATDELDESDDDGATWHAVGPPGNAVETRAFGQDALVVANPHGQDYILTGDTRRYVTGSDGSAVDVAFAMLPNSGGRYAAALLAADDPKTGIPLVLQCDRELRCSNPVQLAGSNAGSGADISLFASADFASNGVVFARTTNSLYRSSDGGRTFLRIPLPQQASAAYTTVPAATLTASGTPPLYAALLSIVTTGASRLTAGGVYASADGGVTWFSVGSPSPLDGGATAVAAMPHGRLLAGYVDAHGDAGLLCSDDAMHWAVACTPDRFECATNPCRPVPSGGDQSAANSRGGASSAASVPSGSDAATPDESSSDARQRVAGVARTLSLPSSIGPLVVLLLMLAIAVGATVAFVSTQRRGRL